MKNSAIKKAFVLQEIVMQISRPNMVLFGNAAIHPHHSGWLRVKLVCSQFKDKAFWQECNWTGMRVWPPAVLHAILAVLALLLSLFVVGVQILYSNNELNALIANRSELETKWQVVSFQNNKFQQKIATQATDPNRDSHAPEKLTGELMALSQAHRMQIVRLGEKKNEMQLSVQGETQHLMSFLNSLNATFDPINIKKVTITKNENNRLVQADFSMLANKVLLSQPMMQFTAIDTNLFQTKSMPKSGHKKHQSLASVNQHHVVDETALDRPKEFMQTVDLGQLKYVGTISQAGKNSALIQVSGILHTVAEGAHVGKNQLLLKKVEEQVLWLEDKKANTIKLIRFSETQDASDLDSVSIPSPTSTLALTSQQESKK